MLASGNFHGNKAFRAYGGTRKYHIRRGPSLGQPIAFALTPNSASCERVFALLKNMYGEEQLSALADQLQAALMLAYNKRRVG